MRDINLWKQITGIFNQRGVSAVTITKSVVGFEVVFRVFPLFGVFEDMQGACVPDWRFCSGATGISICFGSVL